MINVIGIALTGLAAATKKVAASASNIANMQTAGSLEEGKQAPYTPITTQQATITDQSGNSLGVSSQFVPKSNPYYSLYSPDSPFANEEGVIGMPNVDLAEEAVNMMIAEATYKANIATIKTADELTDELLRMVDEKA
jgi:flagellar basal-body rod protein FlgC